MEKDHYVAAIDLGSNSFHMAIAQESEHGSLKIIDRVREMVRLNAGLNHSGDLTNEAQETALECLERFKQRLNTIPANRIRAVGTNTLRNARNSTEFLTRAECALGHPISIISGREEARLVYLGAAFDLSTSGKQRLVVDIGGGSTELIYGEGYHPIHMDSLEIGCVSLTRQVFGDGRITKTRMNLARKLVSRELGPVLKTYKNLPWQEVVGTSGTIKAIEKVSKELGCDQDWISEKSVMEVEKWILKKKNSKFLIHVSDQRRPVFIGGFIILSTIIKELGIDRMDISQGALREGVAYDLIGRLHNEDARFAGVASLISQFQPDLKHANRVRDLAIRFLNDSKEYWDLQKDIHFKLLYWAAQLHEIGISISYEDYQLHSAYLIENSDLDGFSRQMQKILSLLVKSHRSKIDVDTLNNLPNEWSDRIIKLVILLRLSFTFHRSRLEMETEKINITVKNKIFIISLPVGWDKDHPLTVFDLQSEKLSLKSLGFKLKIKFDSV